MLIYLNVWSLLGRNICKRLGVMKYCKDYGTRGRLKASKVQAIPSNHILSTVYGSYVNFQLLSLQHAFFAWLLPW